MALVFGGLVLAAASTGVVAQAVGARDAGAPSADLPPLFDSSEPFALTITADIEALLGDRRDSPDRPATFDVPLLANSGEPGAPDRRTIRGEVRTRGTFRLDPSNCSFPPMRIEVDRADADGTILEGQDHLKLVASCRPGRPSYDELVLLEHLVYRSYALVTEAAFRTRAIVVTFADSEGSREPETRPGFLIEQDDALAARLGAVVYDLEEGKNLPPGALDPVSMLDAAIFQYMAGNPDWSDVAGHNVELLDRGGVAIVVPYDFDFTGLVDAPYATPPERLGIDSVRDRIYRGWCANPLLTAAALERFRASHDAVLVLWSSAAGLSDDTRRRAISYLEEFYDAIETDDRARRRFLRDCRSVG